uniref:Core Histone H2A/H2B/H3 domain-containing protein n=1 Tax=Megaselia scalaris TaxID=36166 RepID=T1GP81_MEGSC
MPRTHRARTRSMHCAGRSSRSISRRHRKRVQTYGKYIRKIFKRIYPDMSISKRAVSVMNSFMNHIFKLIAVEAGTLVHYKKQQTICSAEIKSAVLLLFPRILAQHAIHSGEKATRNLIYSMNIRKSTASKEVYEYISNVFIDFLLNRAIVIYCLSGVIKFGNSSEKVEVKFKIAQSQVYSLPPSGAISLL